ncbi:MAG: hypothetical protein QOG91_639 [Candidatus Parcubacteria bacterium]|jgi:hypothetical protein|nr:hypothetical protein [Candidatus Parcubacteria bacterium]
MTKIHMIFSIFSLLAIGECTRAESVVARLNHANWDAALSSLKEHGDLITEASPIWYRLNAEGVLEKIPEAKINDPRLLSILALCNAGEQVVVKIEKPGEAKEYVRPKPKIMLRPVVSVASAEKFGKAQALAIAAMALASGDDPSMLNGYGGIDLAFEDLHVADIETFMAALEDLAMTLRDSERSLSVSLSVRPSGTDQAAATETLARIASVADSVRLVADDGSKDQAVSTVDPEQARKRLKETAKAVPAAKLFQGISLEKQGRKLDALSIKPDLDAGREAGVAGFFFSSLGNEDPKIWGLLKPNKAEQ